MKKVLLPVLLVGCIIGLTGCTDEIQDSIDEATYVYPDSKNTLVTLDEYNQLKSGMTPQEVWNLIGGECTQTGTTDLGMGEEYVTISYGCNGDGSTGANVLLMFQGNKLNVFSQFGLN